MSEMKEATIFDPNADIEAVAIRFDEGSETWQLQAVGTWEECRQSCLRAKNKGHEEQMRVLRAVHGAMYFNGRSDMVAFRDRSNYANHGTVENADAVDAERYRWLRRQNILEVIEMLDLEPKAIDQTIDVLMSRENPNGG